MKNLRINKEQDTVSIFILTTLAIFLFSFNLLAQESEPNNTAANANTFDVNSSLSANIGTGGDIDWYKITIPEEGSLKIISTSSDCNDYYINLVDVNAERQLLITEVYPLGEVDSVFKTNLQAGTYYVQIYPSSTNYGSYHLKNEFTPALLPNDNEPNNTAAEAIEFPTNSNTTGRLNYVLNDVADNADWYKITIPEEGTLKVISTSPDCYDYYLKLLDVDKERLLSFTEVYPLGEVDSVFKTNLQAGTYYVQIYPSSTNHGSYHLKNEFTPALLPNDSEPNNTAEEAIEFPTNSNTTGRLNYVLDNVADNADWYKITIPEEGTLKIISTSPDDGDYYLKLLDVDTMRVLISTNVYPLGVVGSVFKTNLQAGTYYVQVYPSSTNHGSYHLKNEFTPALLPNDNEPNNTAAEAIEFPTNSNTTGRLNYVLDNVADNADWYKITIPEEGTLKIISTSPDDGDYYLELLDVDTMRVLISTNVYPLGVVGSVFKTNLQAGTYYVQVYPFSTNHGSYHLNNEFTPALLPNDNEQNNTAAEANLIVPDTALTGRLNYILDNVGDTDDWYKFTVTQPGGIKIVSNSPDNGDYYIALLDTDSNTVLQSANVYPLGTIRTIYGWGLQVGATYFIHVSKYSSNVGSYYLDVEFQPAPISSFEAVQSSSTVLFTNTSEYATSYYWDFGDGTSSNQVNPSHTYTSPGAFEITLTATNPNGDVEYSEFVEFRGIQKVEGKYGGNTGNSTVTVYAGGLKPGSIPILRKGGVEIVGTNMVYPNTGQIQAVFDLRDVELGAYDVVIKNPGETEMVLSNAYTVEVGNDPKMYVELVGRNRALLNRWSTYTVEIGNKGNTDAYYQILWLAVPDSIKFKNLEFDLGLYNNPEVESYLADCPPYWELDTLDNAPFNGRLYGIPINKVPADSKISIEFKVKAVVDFQISVFTTNPWFEVDAVGGTKSYSESLDIATMSYNKCVAWAIATMIRDKLAGKLTGLIPGADCFYGSVKTLSEVTLSYNEGKLTVTSLAWNLTQVVWGCAKDVGKNIPWIKALKISKTMIDVTIDIVNSYSADQECQKFKKKDSKDKDVAAVTSLDPNEIVGPSGFGDANYISSSETSYKIYFENKNTASANAIEVWVLDTIDIEKFDIATFKFDNIWIAGNNYNVVEDSASFGLDIDLRPQINTIVRVNGTVDRETGIVLWHFLSLDPATMDITEDPDAGFLPPNSTSPEGEGFVSYSIGLKETVVHNTTISAQAKIVFDFNEPIYTNIYSNTIDRESPVSIIHKIEATNTENVYEIFWQGEDDKSGIDYFNIYMSIGGGDYKLWNSANENLSDTLRMDGSKSYKFFSQSVDKLGNVEPYKGYAEETVDINELKQNVYALSIFPNPVVDISVLKYSIRESGNVSISINNMAGQVIKTVPAKYHTSGVYEMQLVSSEFVEGIYMILVKGNSGTSVSKFVVN